MQFITACGFAPLFIIVIFLIGLGLWRVIKDFLPW